MKTAIYISGIAGMLLILLRIIGMIMEFPLNNLFLILGLTLLVIVFLPLAIIERYRHNKMIDKIINSYKETGKETAPIEKGDLEAKGWGMNNSPFRERKSGLTWGGGNIKGANAKRGTRRNFLKR
jgi:hypothetical protein